VEKYRNPRATEGESIFHHVHISTNPFLMRIGWKYWCFNSSCNTYTPL